MKDRIRSVGAAFHPRAPASARGGTGVPPGSPPVAASAPTITGSNARAPRAGQSLRAPILWGLVFGAHQAASPLAFRWLDPANVHALSITLIAAVYIGFAVADGRPRVIAVESATPAHAADSVRRLVTNLQSAFGPLTPVRSFT